MVKKDGEAEKRKTEGMKEERQTERDRGKDKNEKAKK